VISAPVLELRSGSITVELGGMVCSLQLFRGASRARCSRIALDGQGGPRRLGLQLQHWVLANFFVGETNLRPAYLI
jgi:hypothetical protein